MTAAALALVWVVALSFRRRIDVVRETFLALGGVLLLLPTLHPWYALWVLPFAALLPSRGWLLLAALLPLSYLGGEQLITEWVLAMDLSPVAFLIMAQIIIFLLGWPLEWSEIIIIFVPIFLPMLDHFNVDPLFFGILVALNLQTSFLTPPMAMAAYYLKGVAPPHVQLIQIFKGVMPFLAMVILAMVLLYVFPGIALWLPEKWYG